MEAFRNSYIHESGRVSFHEGDPEARKSPVIKRRGCHRQSGLLRSVIFNQFNHEVSNGMLFLI